MTRADVVRYAFIVRDLHPLLLAGLPAHVKRVRLSRAPWKGGAFPVGASPTRQPLQPEATGAAMEAATIPARARACGGDRPSIAMLFGFVGTIPARAGETH